MIQMAVLVQLSIMILNRTWSSSADSPRVPWKRRGSVCGVWQEIPWQYDHMLYCWTNVKTQSDRADDDNATGPTVRF